MTQKKKKKSVKRKGQPGVVVFWLLLLALAVSLGLWWSNEFTLEVALLGEPEILLDHGSNFTDPGATGSFRGTLFQREPVAAQITVSGQVDTQKPGTYTLTYTASHRFRWLLFDIPFTESCRRSVTVRDVEPPVITLITDPEAYTIPGTPYAEEGYTAWDACDGDITHLVTARETDGMVFYTVSDAAGNTATATRQIRYLDPIAPVITLEGGPELTVLWGQPFQDPGFTAVDNCDGTVTDLVTVTGQVDTQKAGTYTLTYRVADSQGNEAVTNRKVRVCVNALDQNLLAEVPEYDPFSPARSNGKVIYLTFDDGPTAYTPELLKILEAYGVKATFFVVNTGYTHLLPQIAAGGHTVAMHTASHVYSKIYASDEAYFQDLKAIEDIIIQQLGSAPKLLRFPGGTANSVSRKYCSGIMTRVSQKLREDGYRYFDWNVSSEDAVSAFTQKEIYHNVIDTIPRVGSNAVVLQHDTSRASVLATEAIILWGLANGYTFAPLTEDSPSCVARPVN